MEAKKRTRTDKNKNINHTPFWLKRSSERDYFYFMNFKESTHWSNKEFCERLGFDQEEFMQVATRAKKVPKNFVTLVRLYRGTKKAGLKVLGRDHRRKFKKASA